MPFRPEDEEARQVNEQMESARRAFQGMLSDDFGNGESGEYVQPVRIPGQRHPYDKIEQDYVRESLTDLIVDPNYSIEPPPEVEAPSTPGTVETTAPVPPQLPERSVDVAGAVPLPMEPQLPEPPEQEPFNAPMESLPLGAPADSGEGSPVSLPERQDLNVVLGQVNQGDPADPAKLPDQLPAVQHVMPPPLQPLDPGQLFQQPAMGRIGRPPGRPRLSPLERAQRRVAQERAQFAGVGVEVVGRDYIPGGPIQSAAPQSVFGQALDEANRAMGMRGHMAPMGHARPMGHAAPMFNVGYGAGPQAQPQNLPFPQMRDQGGFLDVGAGAMEAAAAMEQAAEIQTAFFARVTAAMQKQWDQLNDMLDRLDVEDDADEM